MTHKEFYIWLEGYLYGKLEDRHINIAPIVEKMGQVKDEFDINKFKHLGKTGGLQPISLPPTIDNDDLGKPPKIVM